MRRASHLARSCRSIAATPRSMPISPAYSNEIQEGRGIVIINIRDHPGGRYGVGPVLLRAVAVRVDAARSGTRCQRNPVELFEAVPAHFEILRIVVARRFIPALF